EVLPHMIRVGGGAIINIGSTNQLMPNIGEAAYTSAKGAMVALTRQLAVDFGPHNIRCNVISPAGMLTEKTLDESTPEDLQQATLAYPLERWASTEEVANVALFLASDLASFITGVNLPVDGGLTTICGSSLVQRELLIR